VSVKEDSVVVDVVKKASPAVVSIVVSKDVSRLQNFGLDPFGFDPFSQFFQQKNSSSSQKQEPVIQQVGAGSGFFVSEDGLILTNKHVVSDEKASYTVMTNDKKTLEAKVVARDPINDLAILKVDIQKAPTLKLADSTNLDIGQKVIAIGYSLGQYQNTVTTGVVSGIGRSITAGSMAGSEQLDGVIQTDAAINPGNSGGPLLNLAGAVIGINTAIDREGQLVGFAIPSSDAFRALSSFQKNGKIARAYLGLRYVIITPELAKLQKLPKDFGALVVRGDTVTDFAVQPGGPADKAGLVENDIILSVDGKKIGPELSLVGALASKNPGDTVTLRVYHKGEEKDVRVVLDESK
jgi:serine protease Do